MAGKENSTNPIDLVGKGNSTNPTDLVGKETPQTPPERWGIDLRTNHVQAARLARSRLLATDRASFLAQLVREIEQHVRRVERKGFIPAVRLNGTSDMPWERWKVTRDGIEYPHVFAAFPDVQFYDYTKWPIRLRKVEGITNYHLTYSLAEDNDVKAREALEAGVNVAVVFDSKAARWNSPAGPLPERYTIDGLDVPVIDGDTTDLRFLDPSGEDGKGCIVGLRAKGRAQKDRTGFVRPSFIDA
jgi:hypothetical protein